MSKDSCDNLPEIILADNNDMDSQRQDNVAAPSNQQKIFIGKCKDFIEAAKNLNLQPKMTFRRIKNCFNKLLSIFSDYLNSDFLHLELSDDGKFCIMLAPNNHFKGKTMKSISTETGNFEFKDIVWPYCECTLNPTKSTRFLADIIRDANAKSEYLSFQKLMILLNTLNPDYKLPEPDIASCNIQKTHPVDRIDYYFISGKGELNAIRFKNGTMAIIGTEINDRTAGDSYYSSGWASLSFEKINFMGETYTDHVNIELSGKEAERIESNLSAILPESSYDFYSHAVDIVYKRCFLDLASTFYRIIRIDRSPVFEEMVNRLTDPYMQNKIPLIKIIQNIAEEIGKLPNENYVSHAISPKINNIYQAVDNALK